jgi:hypothetical protein
MVAVVPATLASAQTGTSHSDSTPTTSTTIPSVTTTTTATLTPLQQYRAALKAYRTQVAQIDATFVAALSQARTTFRAAVATHPSPAQLATDLAQRDLSIAQAATTRAQALTALGAAPQRPSTASRN